MAAQPKPKDIKDYYAALNAYHKQGVTHEGALRSAFQNLLAENRSADWLDPHSRIAERFHSARWNVS